MKREIRGKPLEIMVLAVFLLANIFNQNAFGARAGAVMPDPPPVDVVALYQLTPTAGGNADLKIAGWNGLQTVTATVDNTGNSYLTDMKIGPVSKNIYVIYLKSFSSFPAYSLHLDIRSSVTKVINTQQLPPLPAGLTIKAVGLAVRDNNGVEEPHVVVLGETSTQASVYYYKQIGTGWVQTTPYSTARNTKRFGTYVKLELLTPNSPTATITFAQITTTINGDQADVMTWFYDTTTAAFPPVANFTTLATQKVWSGELTGGGSAVAKPFDFMIDYKTNRTLLTTTPAPVWHDYPSAGSEVYANSGYIQTLLNKPPMGPLQGPWGAGAISSVRVGTQRNFQLVTIEQPGNFGHIQLGQGGKELKIYTSPDLSVPPVSQTIDALPIAAGKPYFISPTVTSHPNSSLTYVGIIYDNPLTSASCTSSTVSTCHQVRVYYYNNTLRVWKNVILDSAPTTTYKIENLLLMLQI